MNTKKATLTVERKSLICGVIQKRSVAGEKRGPDLPVMRKLVVQSIISIAPKKWH